MSFGVFVYGTLRRDQRYYKIIEKYVKRIEVATIKGQLYHLPFGYPAVIKGNGVVSGEVITFRDSQKALQAMDELEGNEYERVTSVCRVVKKGVPTTCRKKCWVYTYPSVYKPWLEKEALLISGGDWVKWMYGDRAVTYFAYGSCMNREDFLRDVKEFEVLGKAVLPGYRVAFTKYSSNRKGGVADLVSAPNQMAEGVLYHFPLHYIDSLDQREGVPSGMYQRKVVEVHYMNRVIPALTYEVVTKLADELAPGSHYRKLILEGADLLSEKYVKWITAHMDNLSKK